MMMRGSSDTNYSALRYCSYVIGSTRLGSAAVLVTVLHQYLFVHAWLSVKIVLPVVHIIREVRALRRCRTPGAHTGSMGLSYRWR